MLYSDRRSPERRCMPLNEWPAADRDLWLATTQHGDLLDGLVARSRCRPVSNRKREAAYGRFLTFLTRRDELPLSGGAFECVDRAMVSAYVDELRGFGNAPLTVLGRIENLYQVLCAVAPRRDWDWIRNVISGVRSSVRKNDNKRHRMVGAEELLELGLTLIKSADDLNCHRDAAVAFRDGLLIAFLALLPLRLGNLAVLELGKTVFKRGETYKIAFEGDAMKNGQPFEVIWPAVLHTPLETWLQKHRPVLAGLHNRWTREIGNAVWVSGHGSPMAKHTIHGRISARTLQAFGKRINPHLFRDIAATTLSLADPKHIRAAAPLLGHSDIATTEKYYLQARMIEATDRYQARLLALRKG
jgi:integrase/recombinase XerD